MGELAIQYAKIRETKKNSPLLTQRTKSSQPIKTPAERILFLQRSIGNQAVQRLIKSGTLQAKLKIGPPGDKYEQEADRVAEQVPGVQQHLENEIFQAKLAINPLVQRQAEEEDPIQAMFTSGLTVNLQAKTEVYQNKTGMPDHLKSGLEKLSSMDLSSVRVHHNSSKPAQLDALAYTQGQDIHVGPGHEKHLPHEGWHVVQQMQGRVKPMMQGKGVSINDDKELERESDVMGVKAIQMTRVSIKPRRGHHRGGTSLQRAMDTKGESEVSGEAIEPISNLNQLIQRKKKKLSLTKEEEELTESIKSSSKVFPSEISPLGISWKKAGPLLVGEKVLPLKELGGSKWEVIKDSRVLGDDFNIEIMQRYQRKYATARQVVKGVTIKKQWKEFSEGTTTPHSHELSQEYSYTKGESVEISTSTAVSVSLIKDWLGIEYSEAISKGKSTEKGPTIIASHPAVPGHRLKAKFLYQELTTEKWIMNLANQKIISNEKMVLINGFGFAVMKEKVKTGS